MVVVGVIVGALVLTSGLGEGRYDLYLRSETATDLNQDTRVVVQGLAIGRVSQVGPVVDSTTGELEFVAQLTIRDRFPDGSTLRLPVGTQARIARPTPIEAPVILLVTPTLVHPAGYLEPGDTLVSERQPSIVDALGSIAETLREEIPSALAETRRLIDLTAETLAQARTFLATTRPLATDALERLSRSLEQTEQIMAMEQTKLGPLQDTLGLLLSETRVVLSRYDTLASTAIAIGSENREALRVTIQELARSAVILQNFADNISRRPLRLLTGVRPPPPDTGKQER